MASLKHPDERDTKEPDTGTPSPPPRAQAWPPICDRCGDALDEPGALMFSPPTPGGQATKFHLCGGCWSWVIDDVRADKDGLSRGQVTAELLETRAELDSLRGAARAVVDGRRVSPGLILAADVSAYETLRALLPELDGTDLEKPAVHP